MHDTTDVRRLTSPLFSQEREVRVIPFSASGSHAHSSVGRPMRDAAPSPSFEKPLSKGKRNRELDSETKHFQQDRARYCQEIEELRRICCAEAERARKLNDAREFYDPEAASSSGGSHVPSQPLSVPSPRGKTCRDSWSQLDTRKSLGTSGHVF